MKLNRLFLLGLFFSTGILNAQTDFRSGYIIKYSGDTLYGKIDYRGDLFMSSICKFKDSENVINEYSPNDISAFRFVDSKYFVSREINQRKVFLEYLIKGEVNIYYMRDDNGDHYYLDKEDVRLTEIPYEKGIKYVDDKQVFFETTRHIGLLNYYMKDAPEFQSKIQSIKKPEHQNLIKLAEAYHNVVCEDEKCIIYEKKLPLVTLEIEFQIGSISRNYNNKDDIFIDLKGNNQSINKNLILYFGIPRVNEKLYIQSGCYFNGNLSDSSGIDYNNYKIPLIFGYRYPKYKFQPTFGYGIGIEKIGQYIYPFTTLNLGFKYKLNRFFLSINGNIDTLPLFAIILPSNSWISYSTNFGLGYKF